MTKMRATMFFAAAAALVATTIIPVGEASAAQCGRASWYALHSRTASGVRMNPSAMTAAHRSLPFGTRVRVDNLSNGKSVVVSINDRGPFVGGRVIDLSRGAATRISMIGSGTARVRVTTLGKGGSGGVMALGGGGGKRKAC